ncbi:hypothetical protein [Sphingomonas yabuuchiae]|uniref:Uncharacterized protein n=1 Tax=Sphingomonas yabuuchiae TaxID=172044 RepID=A0AA41A1W4_9SPHN|nr:hypothetical protein [Sphingomonas yabuuchiae]MBB4610228.1 hypothetical protein [Sphingomonas yabuuchiae]MBN3560478.1 hypothetical protein [Sphingomonas yabuuchiae]
MAWDAMSGEADNSFAKSQHTPLNIAAAADEKLKATAFSACFNKPRYVTIPQIYLNTR